MKSYYDHLGVSPQASNDDIRKAYKTLSLKYHPDKHINLQDKQRATQIFNLIHEAYNILSDGAKREIYDKYLIAQRNTEKMMTEQNELLRNTQRYRIPHLESLRKLASDEEHNRQQLEALKNEFQTNYETLKTKLAEIDKQSLQQSDHEEMVKSEQKVSEHNTGSNDKKSADNKTSAEQDIPRRSTTHAKGIRESQARFATQVNLKGETELHVAIKLKDIKRVMSLQLNNVGLVTHYKKQNFIHYIAKYINFDLLQVNEQEYIFQLIIKHSKLISDQDKNGNTPLHIALKYFNCKLVLFFLVNRSDVNIFNKDQKNILHVMLEDVLSEQTIVKQCFDMALKLISDVNAKDILGNTALHYAVANNNTYAVNALLMRGADINVQNEEGNTPLHYAASYGNYHAVIELLKRKAHIVVNKREEVPLHNAITALNNLWTDKIQDQQNIICFLLKASGKQVLSEDANKQSPLHYAVSNDVLNLEVINLLLKYDAPVNLQDKEGNSSFHILLTRDRCVDFFAAFIAKGADIYLTNKENRSPLLLMIENSEPGYISILSKLLNMETVIKIDLNKISCENKSILYAALLWGDLPLVKLLMEKGALLNKNDGTPDEILTKLRNNAGSEEIVDLAKRAIELSFVKVTSDKVLQKRTKSLDEEFEPSKRERPESPNAVVNPANIASALFKQSHTPTVEMQQAPDCDMTDSLRKSGRR